MFLEMLHSLNIPMPLGKFIYSTFAPETFTALAHFSVSMA